MDTALLIKEAKQGSNAAQKCLFDMCAERMNILCRRYVKSREDAEEIMLDGFYKFFKTISSFHYNSEIEMYSWIRTIMVNECLMFLRKKNGFHIVADTDGIEILLEEEALNNLSAAEIFNLVVQLPVGYRTVFNLNVVEGMEHKEIASLLGITAGTSKSQLSRAKVLLQKMLTSKGTEYVRRKLQ